MFLKIRTVFRSSFLFLLIAMGPNGVCALEHRFERLSSPEPPHRSVFALLQDRDGFLWIGTQDGLARYDGYRMRTLRHDPNDPASLSSGRIRTMLEDARGRLWVGTENGLNLVDRDRFEVRRIPTPEHPVGRGAWFNCALADRDGILWFGADDGLLRVDPTDLDIQVVLDEGHGDPVLVNDAVVAVQQDLDGRIWAVTTDRTRHALLRLGPDGEIEQRIALGDGPERILSFLIDSKNRLWKPTMPS